MRVMLYIIQGILVLLLSPFTAFSDSESLFDKEKMKCFSDNYFSSDKAQIATCREINLQKVIKKDSINGADLSGSIINCSYDHYSFENVIAPVATVNFSITKSFICKRCSFIGGLFQQEIDTLDLTGSDLRFAKINVTVKKMSLAGVDLRWATLTTGWTRDEWDDTTALLGARINQYTTIDDLSLLDMKKMGAVEEQGANAADSIGLKEDLCAKNRCNDRFPGFILNKKNYVIEKGKSLRDFTGERFTLFEPMMSLELTGTFNNVKFNETPISNSIFSGSTFFNVGFEGALILSSSFQKNKLHSISFKSLDGLYGRGVKNGLIDSSTFSNIDGAEVTMEYQHMANSIVENSTFKKFSIRNSKIKNTTFRNVAFDELVLTDSTLENVVFEKCTFNQSQLLLKKNNRVRFVSSAFQSVDFRGSNFIGIAFENCSFKEVLGNSQDDFVRFGANLRAKLPFGLTAYKSYPICGAEKAVPFYSSKDVLKPAGEIPSCSSFDAGLEWQSLKYYIVLDGDLEWIQVKLMGQADQMDTSAESVWIQANDFATPYLITDGKMKLFINGMSPSIKAQNEKEIELNVLSEECGGTQQTLNIELPDGFDSRRTILLNNIPHFSSDNSCRT